MDKSSDSSSDSDSSSSSTSWVFVDDASPVHEKSTNTFHLDCSREPIQELTEQDLFSAGSDLESDTDGISVISESEVPVDDLCQLVQPSDDNEFSEAMHNVDSVPSEETATEILLPDSHANLFDLTKLYKPFHMLGIGFFLTAVFLASYSNIAKVSDETADDFINVDDGASYDNIEVDDCTVYDKMQSCDQPDLYDAKTNFYDDLEQIIDLTITCVFRHTPRNDYINEQIKKCVKSEYNTKAAGSTEVVDDSRSEVAEDGTKAKSNGKFDNFNKLSKKSMERNYNEDFKPNYNEKLVNKRRTYQNSNKNKFNVENSDVVCHAKKEKSKIMKMQKRGERSDVHNTEDNFNRKEHNLQECTVNEYKQKSQFNNKEPTVKIPKYIKKSHMKLLKTKKHPDYKKKTHGDQKKYESILTTHPGLNWRESQKILKRDNTNSKYADAKTKNFHSKIKLQRRFNATSGEWYTNLHKARNQLRRQEHVSDWVFDRAYLRSKKRNKAQWYFKWMNIREQMRYKQSYKPYSI